MNIDDALAISSKRFMSLDEVALLCESTSGEISATLNALAVEVAGRYLRGDISFTAADSLMNNLFDHAARRSVLPPAFMRVYEAFDQGEYHHSGDAEGVDSEVVYTKPMLLTLIAEGLLPKK